MGYLKKKVKDERGVWIPVYAKTPEELEAKVTARLTQIEAAKALAANPYVYQVAADWYATTTQRSFKRREDYRNAINRHICPVIGQMHISEVSAADVDSVMAAGTAAACRTRSPARSDRCSRMPRKRDTYQAARAAS